MTQERRVDVSAAEFLALFQAVSNWGRWGEDDELGTLNELSADRVVCHQARRQRGDGHAQPSVGHGGEPRQPAPGGSPNDPAPRRRHRIWNASVRQGLRRRRLPQRHAHPHRRALPRRVRRRLLQRQAERRSHRTAAGVNTIEAEERSRRPGVLLDVPRLRGSRGSSPASTSSGRTSKAPSANRGDGWEGDILLVRTGHARRLRELGPWDTAKAKAGLHPTTVLYLAERSVAVLGSDGNGDTAPSTTEGIGFPIHALTLNAMGLP